MKELCAAFTIDLDSDDFDLEGKTEERESDSRCVCRGRRKANEKMSGRPKKPKVVNQGFKSVFEEDSSSGTKGGGEGTSKTNSLKNQKKKDDLKDTQEEDFEILDKVFDLHEKSWGEKCCPHCLSIDQLEEMLKKEAEKYAEIAKDLHTSSDDSGCENQDGNSQGSSSEGEVEGHNK